MGKLVAFVGNCGSGKTTLARLVCAAGGYRPLLEQHVERPFQQAFFADRSAGGFANQIDYLLYRAEQELAARGEPGVGVLDGGLDQDFHLFTHLFHRKGYLSQAEFDVCRRFYDLARHALPAPEAIVCLRARREVLAARRVARQRTVDIVQEQDLGVLDELLADWIENAGQRSTIIELDTSREDVQFSATLPGLMARLRDVLGTA